ncbi:MAG TPA: acyloxyacyl hydrolase [Acidobacteriaceae bacterium]|nr:acyloxyacyl hydrolase [Acidobacteriaceae bacterium]
MRRLSCWYLALVVLLALAGTRTGFAQEGPETDGNEIEIWTAGGHGTNGVTQHTGVFSVGFRYGWVITAPHGPGLLRGRFEYAVDAVPVYLVFQRTNTAYGAAVNPFALIWNLDTQGRVLPYIELGGGALFTSTQVPEGTSRINFTTAGAVGAHILTKKVTWTADIRFMHISNAGLKPLNPGINTAQLRLGVSWFTHPHR